MTGREMGFRLARATRLILEDLGIGLAIRPPQPADRFGRPWCSDLPPDVLVEPYLHEADKILAGTFSVFTLRNLALGFPPQWNRDPKLDVVVPLVFGKKCGHRSKSGYQYTRYLWELNRHSELVRLSQAYALSGDFRYAAGCRTMLESWFEQCPYPLGPNWNSSLEHGVRLVNWAIAWHLLGGAGGDVFSGAAGADFRKRWLDSVYQHCHFIAGNLSLHSSANNHLMGEYTGLFVGSVTWPCWSECEQWRERSVTGLETEMLLQVSEDGVDREQAIGYHRAVATMTLLVDLFGRKNGVQWSSAFRSRLEAMLGYVADMMDVAGNLPSIGDSDDAAIVNFAPGPDVNLCRSLLAVGAVLFSSSHMKRKAQVFGDAARWWLGKSAATAFAELPEATGSTGRRRAYPQGGYYVLGKNLDDQDEVRLTVKAGPLGLPPLAGHGHADALSMTLTVRGLRILVDSGTYDYQAVGKWRDYFRGTSAHNTVRIDGIDQSQGVGTFQWVKWAEVRCETIELEGDSERFSGTHDGYSRLSDPVRHWRCVEYDAVANCITVTDRLESTGRHVAEIFWHLSEECAVDITGSGASVEVRDVCIDLNMTSPGWQARAYCGDTALPQGWLSRRYGERIAAPVVVFDAAFVGTVEATTRIRIRHP